MPGMRARAALKDNGRVLLDKLIAVWDEAHREVCGAMSLRHNWCAAGHVNPYREEVSNG
jgi:hypothetical protein